MRFTVLATAAALAGSAVAQSDTLSAPASLTTDPDIPDSPNSTGDTSTPIATLSTSTTDSTPTDSSATDSISTTSTSISSTASDVSTTSTSSSAAPAGSVGTGWPSVNLFDNFGPIGAVALNSSQSFSYNGAILDACKDRTVYAIQCMAPTDAPGCGPNNPPVTLTEGPSIYIASQKMVSTSNKDTTTTIATETCTLAGSTAATCTQVTTKVFGSTTTSSTATMTYSGSNYRRYDVNITAGADKTSSPTGKCGNSSGVSLRAGAGAGMLAAFGLVMILVL